MKKKMTALLLAVCLIVCLAGVSAAADDKLTFISINDTLPPELIGCVASYGGATYVPYYIFSSYGFGISYSYDSATSTASLSAGDRELNYEIGTGVTYDGDDYKYSVSAILRSGTVYVPLNFTARFFGGISYSNITGSEYGNILRITDGTEVLTDAEFLRAAKSVLRNYALARQPKPEQEPTPTPEPTPVPTPEPADPHEGERVDLSFAGLPADAVLNRLAQGRVSACFFLTAEDIRSAPDTVRRIVCEGHGIGIYCGENLAAEYAEASGLLFDAARACTEMVTASGDYDEACREQAKMAGLAYCGFDLTAPSGGSAYGITSQLENGSGGASVCMGCGEDDLEALSIVLNYLRSGKFDVGAPRETN